MSWALALPKQTLENPSARHVLLCLANYAGSDGRGAFPSANTLPMHDVLHGCGT